MTRPMIDQDGPWTVTVPTGQAAVDQWLAEHLPPEPALSRAEVDECAMRLARLHELEGAQGEVLMAFAVTVMHRRDEAARVLLRMLRSLEASQGSGVLDECGRCWHPASMHSPVGDCRAASGCECPEFEA